LGCSAKTKRKNILKWTIVIGKFDEEFFAGFALERFPVQISASFTADFVKIIHCRKICEARPNTKLEFCRTLLTL
jgi:hypothetical protein